MAIRPILSVGDPRDVAVLKTVSAPVEQVDDGVRALMNDMLETMYAAPGIGLAAVQVGVAKRIIVMDLAREGEPPEPRRLVNPEILWRSEEMFGYEEGCLSVPEIFDEVQRPARVRVRWQDETGAVREEEAEGVLAVCIQHEIDHLQGVLFIDHLSRLKRERAVSRVRKAARAAA